MTVNIELNPFDAIAIVVFLRENKHRMSGLAGLKEAAQAFDDAVSARINPAHLEDAKAEKEVNKILSDVGISKEV